MDRVLCLGHWFPDLVIEREALAGAATVEDGNPMVEAQRRRIVVAYVPDY